MQSVKLNIRPFRPADETAIRELCYATGCLGRTASEWVDANEALFSDFWLEYYFRREPELILVAEVDGKTVGYLTGSLDARRRARYMVWPFSRHFIRSLVRGRYRAGRRTAAVLARALWDAVTVGFPRIPRAGGYEAHMHYNVLPEVRRIYPRCGLELATAFGRELLERGVTRFHGSIVLPKGRAGTRYQKIGRIHDIRACRLFRTVTDRKLFLATVTVDIQDTVRRHPQHFPSLCKYGCRSAAGEKGKAADVARTPAHPPKPSATDVGQP